MYAKTLIFAAAALVASAAIAAPGSTKPKNEVRGAVMFWLLDRNNNGSIEKAEIEALRATIFDTVDADNSGRVTRDEFVAIIENLQGQRVNAERHGDRRDGPRKGGVAEQRGERMMNRLGIDANEGLNRAEFVTATPRLFESVDKDENGSVSQSEFNQASGRIGRLIIME